MLEREGPTEGLSGGTAQTEEDSMLYWALAFLVIALIAAVFGFGGIAAASAGIAKILFFVFVALFVVSLIVSLMGRGRRHPL